MAQTQMIYNPSDVCRECSGMERAIQALEKSDHEQWQEIKGIRALLYGVLVSSLLAASGVIINLIIVLSKGAQ